MTSLTLMSFANQLTLTLKAKTKIKTHVGYCWEWENWSVLRKANTHEHM